ncbi:hypothetical protein ACF8LD_04985 [Pseudomonas sp. zbq_5]|uniref:hypothetical protein n=1 Tax=unclassified Pseudomonas TaxID=196821 RepID=UPI00370C81DB
MKLPIFIRARWKWLKSQPFERWAGLLTSAYLSLFLGVLIARARELFSLPLNELGDFAAGVFAPLAFLWLVLGYRQQGKELRESSDALRAQSEELRRSVELQAKSVSVLDRLNDPVIEVTKAGPSLKWPGFEMLRLKNQKNICYQVTIDTNCPSDGRSNGGELLGTFVEGEEKIYTLGRPIVENESFLIAINYIRMTGTEGTKLFRVFGPGTGSSYPYMIMALPTDISNQ